MGAALPDPSLAFAGNCSRRVKAAAIARIRTPDREHLRSDSCFTPRSPIPVPTRFQAIAELTVPKLVDFAAAVARSWSWTVKECGPHLETGAPDAANAHTTASFPASSIDEPSHPPARRCACGARGSSFPFQASQPDRRGRPYHAGKYGCCPEAEPGGSRALVSDTTVVSRFREPGRARMTIAFNAMCRPTCISGANRISSSRLDPGLVGPSLHAPDIRRAPAAPVPEPREGLHR